MPVWRTFIHLCHPGFIGVVWSIAMLVLPHGAFAQTPAAETDSRARGLLPEPPAFARLMEKIAERTDSTAPPREGVYPAVGTSMPGAGLAAGPGFRHYFGASPFQFDSSAAVSWRQYTQAQAGLAGDWFNGALRIGAQVLWQDQTQVNYFGLGSSSSLSNRSEYRVRGTDYTLAVTVQPGGGWSLQAGSGLLDRPDVSGPTGWHDQGFPDTHLLFTPATAPGLDVQPRFWHSDVSLGLDRLDQAGHPRRGWLFRTSAVSYRDLDLGRFSFWRYEAEAVQAVPLSRAIWTLLIQEAAVISNTQAGQEVPFYLQPRLGGQNGLRGYLDYRFYDRNAAAIAFESRWALLAHLDGALFVDTGGVAAHPRGFNRSAILTSYGAGLRLHTGADTIVNLDVANSAEGWRFLLSFSDPFQLSLFHRRAAVVPIVP